MTPHWWQCRECYELAYNSSDLYRHKCETGHNDAALITRDGGTGVGSTDAGRARARAIYEQARHQARADAIAAPDNAEEASA